MLIKNFLHVELENETNLMNYQSTESFFNLTSEELLITNDSGYTKEENMLFDSGIKVTFFDDAKEFFNEYDTFVKWLREDKLEIEFVLRTINERLVVIAK